MTLLAYTALSTLEQIGNDPCNPFTKQSPCKIVVFSYYMYSFLRTAIKILAKTRKIPFTHITVVKDTLALFNNDVQFDIVILPTPLRENSATLGHIVKSPFSNKTSQKILALEVRTGEAEQFELDKRMQDGTGLIRYVRLLTVFNMYGAPYVSNDSCQLNMTHVGQIDAYLMNNSYFRPEKVGTEPPPDFKIIGEEKKEEMQMQDQTCGEESTRSSSLDAGNRSAAFVRTPYIPKRTRRYPERQSRGERPSRRSRSRSRSLSVCSRTSCSSLSEFSSSASSRSSSASSRSSSSSRSPSPPPATSSRKEKRKRTESHEKKNKAKEAEKEKTFTEPSYEEDDRQCVAHEEEKMHKPKKRVLITLKPVAQQVPRKPLHEDEEFESSHGQEKEDGKHDRKDKHEDDNEEEPVDYDCDDCLNLAFLNEPIDTAKIEVVNLEKGNAFDDIFGSDDDDDL